jgi:hypothetical protein
MTLRVKLPTWIFTGLGVGERFRLAAAARLADVDLVDKKL